MMPKSITHNTDCLEFMRSLPDGYFSLAIADPPYGDGMGGGDLQRGTWHNKHKYKGENGGIDNQQVTPPHQVEQVRTTIRPIQESGADGTCRDDRRGMPLPPPPQQPRNQHITPSERGNGTALTRTGGTWATKYAKKS